MKAVAVALCLMGSAAFGQDGIQYDGDLLTSCLAQTQASNAQADMINQPLRQCVGVAATNCMQIPGGETTIGMVQCLSAETADWDKLLNQAYETAMTAAKAQDADLQQLGSAATPAAPMLQQAQRHWIAFRDASCTYESVKFYGGTAGGPAAADCMMALTATQALRLQDIARGME